ncbi:MAG: serine hydrolase domain-containing protein [Cyanobacteria bacterium P01_G01_bin.54]
MDRFESQLHSVLRTQYESSELIGVNFAFYSPATGEQRLAAGFEDSARTQPLAPEQPWPIFSITKTYLAVLTLRLQEQGRLRLQQRLDRWFPAIPQAAQITIRQLLNHTSGLPNYTSQSAYNEAVQAHPRQPWDCSKILDCALQAEPDFPPGAGWRYCNTGYWLLGDILTRTTGLSLKTLLQQQIFGPLGLQSTDYPEQFPQLTPGWSRQLSPAQALEDIRDRYHPRWAGPAGAIVSTAGDVCRFFRVLLLERRLLSAESFAQMLTWQPVPGNHPASIKPYYGLGIGCEMDLPEGDLLGHGGCGPGYMTIVRCWPERQTVTVLFSNTDEREIQACFYPTVKAIWVGEG